MCSKLFVLDDFGPRRREKERVGVAARCAVRPSVYASGSAAAPLGCCEFATGVIHEVCSGRRCGVIGCYCPPSVFAEAKGFEGCSVRLEKLKLLQEQT